MLYETVFSYLTLFTIRSCRGEAFAVKVQNNLDKDLVAFKVFMDGAHVHTQVCEPGDVRDIYGVSTHTWGTKRFMFQPIVTSRGFRKLR